MLHMTAGLIPNFSGRDDTYSVTRWIEDVESNAEIFEWTPLQQLLIARRALTGTALLWLRAERPHKTWEELKAALLKEFPDHVDIKSIYELMSSRKKQPNETCLDYMLIMKELGKRGKMPDYVAIKYIVDGIVDIEINKIMLYGVTSYNDLKDKLKIYETITKKMQSAAQVQRRSAVSSSNKHRSSGKTWIRCYGCGEVGRASSDCPHKSKGLKCFKCNQFGHVGSACTTSAVATLPATPKSSHRTSSEEFGKTRQSYQPRHTKSAMFAADVTQDDGGASGDLLCNERQDYQHTKRAMFTTVNDEEDSAPSGYFPIL
ncbi:uncharacterized protein LOC126912844 [Spodoptera frugiperda]|uniref:Uncharacterized protein LOC126912844 n=1 Tax=Spodoptera frugiperda TaxID=7108 RepID=A0A9R0EBW9_SPOFR|nr:uncharacterized protein LOC126912844 [Spodoptera frugiperda]